MRCKLEKLCEMFPKNFEMKVFVVFFKLEILKVFTNSIYETISSQQQNYGWTSIFVAEKCHLLMSDCLSEKNSYKDIIQTEKIFAAENLILKLKDLLSQGIVLKAEFWQKIYRGISNINDLKYSVKQQINIAHEFLKLEK